MPGLFHLNPIPMNLFKRPKSTKIDLSTLKVKELEYFCKTSVLDKMVHEKMELPYNQDTADEMEKFVCFYMIIKKNGEYDAVSGPKFDAWKEQKGVPDLQLQKTASAQSCIDHFVKFLVKEHKDAAYLLERQKDELPQKLIN